MQHWPVGRFAAVTPTRAPTRLQPSLPGFVFLILALLVPLFDGANMFNADGDTARHLRHGETILQQGAVIRSDQFSFTYPGKEVVGFEYGSQVLLALSYRLGGTPGVASLTTLVVCTVLSMLLAWMIRRGAEPLLAVLTVLTAAILSSIHWIARPHVFSWPLMLLLFFWLEAPRRPPVWAFGLLFMVWANLHGAFVFGWMLLGFYFTGHLLESRWSSSRSTWQEERSAAWELLPRMAMAVGATVINPYGWKLPVHVLEFFRDPWIPRLTQEFQSPDFLREHRAFLIVLTGVLLILALRPRPRWTHFIVIAGTSGMALMMNRNIALFGLLAVPLVALLVRQPWSAALGGFGPLRRFEAASRRGATAPYVVLAILALLGLAVIRGRIGGAQVVPDGFDRGVFPVNAVQWARGRELQGRLFHEFEWGGYLLHAWPEQKIFIDGGTDFFTGAFMRAQGMVLSLQPGWRDSLAGWRVDRALLRSRAPLAAELLRSGTWRPLYCDETAILLERTQLDAESLPPSDCPSRGSD